MQNTYAMTDYSDAKRVLDQLHRESMDLNPGAARSLEEGLEETLTVHKLGVPDQLRRTLASTNVIESAFSISVHLRPFMHVLAVAASGGVNPIFKPSPSSPPPLSPRCRSRGSPQALLELSPSARVARASP